MNRIFNNCPFSFQFDITGATCTGIGSFITTTTGNPMTIKYCIYCTKQTTVLCEKGACYSCHKENLCHGELKK